MTTQLDALKQQSLVVADTGDLDAIRRYQPHDATTNPSLILKAFDLPAYQPLIDEIVAKANILPESADSRITHAMDELAVAMGSEIAGLVPGRVSTEVSATLSFDTDASMRKAYDLIERYEQRGVGRERVLIKLAATWEGIRAAASLEREGIQCNLTLLFSEAQAQACFDAGVFLVSPFVGRVSDWYSRETGNTYAPNNDPGVQFVRRVCDRASQGGYETVVMGASFRNIGQVLALAGCPRLTISPALLEELSVLEGDVKKQIFAAEPVGKRYPELSQPDFLWQHNQDAMAVQKLGEGIRQFAKDQDTLETLLAKRVQG